jgi:hypothetical protein
MVPTCIPQIQYALNFFVNAILTFYCCSQVVGLWHFSKHLLATSKLWFCPTFWWRDTTIYGYLVVFVFTSRPTANNWYITKYMISLRFATFTWNFFFKMVNI